MLLFSVLAIMFLHADFFFFFFYNVAAAAAAADLFFFYESYDTPLFFPV